MIKYILTVFLLLLSSCASTDRTYFTDTTSDKPYAKLYMEQKGIGGLNLFGVTVTAITPFTINGLPVDAKQEYWKLHAFGEFMIPAGDTMVTLGYSDRDNSDRGFVRFTAQAGKTYQVTHRLGDTFIHFDVTDEESHQIATQTFHKWQYIWEKTPEEETLLFAAQKGDLAQVESSLKQGANPNWSRAYRKFKPITVAAANGHLDIVAALVQAGVDINPVNQITPLEAACMHGHIQVVQLLLKHGAYPDLGTPLIAAAEHGHIAIIRLLLEGGAYTLSRNSEGLTASELAQRNGHVATAQLIQTYQAK
jgi:hypothetical protein